MTGLTEVPGDARTAYAALAPAYDALTADYCHDRWLTELEALARRYGVRGGRALDIACGTGKSFAPLLKLGYRVTACDISREMLERAHTRGAGARLVCEDMRTLPQLGCFDLVTCLDDALNYVLDPGELRATFEGVAANLDPDGVAVFDLNTLKTYRTSFARTWVLERDGFFLVWEGSAAPDMPAGGTAEITIHVFSPDGVLWDRGASVHRQRHWPADAVAQAAASGGLEILAAHGQRVGARLDLTGPLDEHEHDKAVFVARRTVDARG